MLNTGLPFGSRIIVEVNKDGRPQISIPRSGVAKHKPIIVFSCIWLLFLTAWTTGAFFTAGKFSLISLPFWAVGLLTVYAVIGRIVERQEIIFNKENVTVITNKPLGLKVVTVPYSDIEKVELQVIHGLQGQNQLPNCAPTIFCGTEKTHLGLHVSDLEKDWLVKFLNVAITQQT